MDVAVRKFGIFVSGGFPLISYASIVGALHDANEIVGTTTFEWETISTRGDPTKSRCGVVVHSNPAMRCEGSRQPEPAQCVVLLSNVYDASAREAVLAWLRTSLARGARVLSVGGGTELLCEAGMLDGRRCAVHWTAFGVAVESFPGVTVSRAFYEIDGPFHTCAGELSTFDVMMRLIESEVGSDVVESVSARALQGTLRSRGERQTLPNHARLERFGSPLLHLIDLMEDNISDPLPLCRLVEEVPLSRRQVERLFEKQMGMSPKRFYLQLRLQRAWDLLQYSSMPIVDVAVATGFVSHSHFTKTFKTAYGAVPILVRRSTPTKADLPNLPRRTPNNDNSGADSRGRFSDVTR